MIYCNTTLTLSVLARLVKSRHRSNVLSARYLIASRTGGKNLGSFFFLKKTLEMRSVHNIYCSRGLAFDITHLVSTLNTYLEKTFIIFVSSMFMSLLYFAHNHLCNRNLHVRNFTAYCRVIRQKT